MVRRLGVFYRRLGGVVLRSKTTFGRSNLFFAFVGCLLGFTITYLVFTIIERDRWPIPSARFIDSYIQSVLVPQQGPPVSNVETEHKEHVNGEEDKIARQIAEEVRLLCWIMTQPKSHQSKAIHVKKTWGRRCNYLIFMSSESDPSLPAIKVQDSEGRNYLWSKTKGAFKYVHQHYLDKVDWVLKADDDTYTVIENLKYILSQHNASEKLFFGCRFGPFVQQGYMSGGAGYVMSREAVKVFVEDGLPNKEICRQDPHGAEDVEVGKCLENLGVKIIDSRDSFGRHRFLPIPPVNVLTPGHISSMSWFWKWMYYPLKVGFDCCSDTTISFHYVTPDNLYLLEFMIYHLRPFGINHNIVRHDSHTYYAGNRNEK